MNKRIKELAEQATRQCPDEYDLDTTNEVDLNKFAELIVRECCQQINSQCFPSNSREWCQKGAWNGYLVAQIREHFGVEE